MPIIYGIWADDARLPYYGSTIQTLAKRKSKHKIIYNLWKEGVSGKSSSYDLFDAVGFDACQFEIVEQLPDDISKDDLLWRERWYIENCPCINKNRPILTDEERVEYQRQYNETHKEELDEYRRQYYEAHKEEIIERSRQYNETHKEKRDEYHRQYYEAHKEQKNEYGRQYRARKKAERIEAFKAMLKTDS